jgi:hypothetical protein
MSVLLFLSLLSFAFKFELNFVKSIGNFKSQFATILIISNFRNSTLYPKFFIFFKIIFAAFFEFSSLLAPRILIYPELKIRKVVFGSLFS